MRIIISVPGRFHLFNLARQLLFRGHSLHLITSYPKIFVCRYGIPKKNIESIFLKEVLERGWKKLPHFIRGVYNPQYFIHELFDISVSKKILNYKADIINGGSSVFLRTLRKAKLLSMITILERGSSHIQYQNSILKEEYEKFGIKTEAFQLPHPKIIEKELQEYEEADYISIPSSYVRRTFLEKGVDEKKLIQVPYGVDLSSFKQISKDDNIFRIIFAGGMTLRKGVHYLLQAFSELNLPNSELLLIGSMNDEMRGFFRKYNVGEGKIKYIGHIPQNELHKYYSQGSVFVLMSIEEGLAMVQPQAMACGLPVICTTNTGGEDIVRDGMDGFVIPIRDIEMLKEKILFMYEHQDICKQMGQSAEERVTSGFTWDDYGKKIIQEYERILEGRKF